MADYTEPLKRREYKIDMSMDGNTMGSQNLKLDGPYVPYANRICSEGASIPFERTSDRYDHFPGLIGEDLQHATAESSSPASSSASRWLSDGIKLDVIVRK